jgi:hypothetical protein
MAIGSLFSGEPLPVAPKVDSAEISAFHRKLLDYLRRLAGKLDAAQQDDGSDPTSFGQVQAFSAFLDDYHDLSSVGTYGTKVEWDQELWQDSPFSHSNGVIRMNVDGFYLFNIDLSIDFVGYVDAILTLAIVDVTGTIIAIPDFAYAHATPFSHTMTIGLPLPSGTRVALFVKTNIDGAAGLLPTGSRINILRVRNSLDGGDGDPPGVGWDPDPDNDDYPLWVLVVAL